MSHIITLVTAKTPRTEIDAIDAALMRGALPVAYMKIASGYQGAMQVGRMRLAGKGNISVDIVRDQPGKYMLIKLSHISPVTGEAA